MRTLHPSLIATTLLGIFSLAILNLAAAGTASAQSTSASRATWTGANEIALPKNWREWVFLGSPLTPHALNDGKAPFPEYHNTYINPESYAAFRKTGAFPEGTVLFKELQLTMPGENPDGSRTEVSGRGYFPGAFNGADVAVKDSKRCATSNGWCYFNFGHQPEPYLAKATAMPKEKCASCHEANATKDMVFTKFYGALKR